MKAKEYLLQIRNIDRKIENKQLQLDSLYDMAKSITVTPKEIDIQTSPALDPMGDTIAKIVDLQDELNRDIDRYVDMKLEAMRLINQMDNPDHANILIRRYINYDSWQDIADLMGISRQAVDKKHGISLVEFQRLVDKSLHE